MYFVLQNKNNHYITDEYNITNSIKQNYFD